MKFEELCNDVIYEILKFLEPQDVVRIILVSKELSTLASSDIVWKSFLSPEGKKRIVTGNVKQLNAKQLFFCERKAHVFNRAHQKVHMIKGFICQREITHYVAVCIKSISRDIEGGYRVKMHDGDVLTMDFFKSRQLYKEERKFIRDYIKTIERECKIKGDDDPKIEVSFIRREQKQQQDVFSCGAIALSVAGGLFSKNNNQEGLVVRTFSPERQTYIDSPLVVAENQNTTEVSLDDLDL